MTHDDGSDRGTDLAVVFIHGANHSGACWRPTIAELAKAAPGLRTLGVDLPGRRTQPGNLRSLTVAACVDSVVRQIDEAGINRVFLVAHSLGGITQLGVIAQLGPERVLGALYLAACIPPDGASANSTLKQPVRGIIGLVTRLSRGQAKPVPRPVASWMFTNGMDRATRERALSELVPDSTGLSAEAVYRRRLPRVPTTYVVTLQDHSLRPSAQRQFIDNLGHVDEVVELDACHNAMQSHPIEVARLIIARMTLAFG